MRKLPKSMAVLGGGPVALELAYYFFNLGVDVTIIQRSEHVLSEHDSDLGIVVEESFRKKGIKVYTGTKLERFSGNKIIEFKQKGKKIKIKVDEILMAMGRVPNLDNDLKVNDYLQTSDKNIYVAGDASGILNVVNVAVEQGRVAAENMFGKKEKIDYHKFPVAVYCHPEVAIVGVTEKEVKEKNLDVEIGKLSYKDLGKAICLGEEEGFIKFIVDKKSKEILGVAIVGYEASDIIHEALPLLYNKNTLYDLAKMPHLHPSFGEIFSYLVDEML